MFQKIRQIPQRLLNRFGYQLNHIQKQEAIPPDVDMAAQQIIRRVRPYTMASVERIFTLLQSIRYLADNKITGDIVECGVWRGGSMMAVALELQRLQCADRHLYLFDTFEGMTQPTEYDISYSGSIAVDKFSHLQRDLDSADWCYASLEDVRQNMFSTNYPDEKTHFIKGKVEETLLTYKSGSIALLRLDTDWYESTRYELEQLYPRLVPGGILIIDDYGHWQGCRKAVDEYFAQHGIFPFLMRIDYTARLLVKP